MRVTNLSPIVPFTLVTLDGTVAGVHEEETTDGAEVPTELVAVNVTVYACPLES